MSDKESIYAETKQQLVAVLDGEDNLTARMATVSCLLAHAFPDRYFWTGFYTVDPKSSDELVVGPYQGTMGCLRIPFGRGVCGTAAVSGETQIVEDVHAIENHIACDSRSNSEIVVPVHNASGEIIAVFDVDSEHKGAFDAVDARHLEDIMAACFSQ